VWTKLDNSIYFFLDNVIKIICKYITLNKHLTQHNLTFCKLIILGVQLTDNTAMHTDISNDASMDMAMYEQNR
jgi:hypothetical protein